MPSTASKTLTAILIVLIAVFGLSFLANPQTDNQPSKLKIATTIFALYDIASNIGKDKVEVIPLIPPGASPHTFEPAAQNIQNAAGAKIVFKIGFGLDDWVQTIVESSGETQIKDVSAGIRLRQEQNLPDPHYWLSFNNAAVIAQNIANALIELDPKNKNHYELNLAAYKQKLLNEDSKLKAKFAGLRNKSIATFHGAWFYFAERYGLSIDAVFEEFPGKEPTAAYLADFIDKIKKNNIRVIYAEPEFPAVGIQQTADDLAVKLDMLNPIEATMRTGDTYIQVMLENGNKIYNNLSQ